MPKTIFYFVISFLVMITSNVKAQYYRCIDSEGRGWADPISMELHKESESQFKAHCHSFDRRAYFNKDNVDLKFSLDLNCEKQTITLDALGFRMYPDEQCDPKLFPGKILQHFPDESVVFDFFDKSGEGVSGHEQGISMSYNFKKEILTLKKRMLKVVEPPKCTTCRPSSGWGPQCICDASDNNRRETTHICDYTVTFYSHR
ncbi:MAG: hypothetical protein KDD48_06870 [Bdellovibrionales bacterium]|nr:hypothetical protein [Bdellovibrionales bacterium]